MVGKNYIMAVSAADDAIVVPTSRIRTISCASDSAIIIYCDPGIHDPTGTDADADIITLAITADTEVATLKSLVEQLNAYPHQNGSVLMICDDVNSVFAHANITSCTITRNAI